MHVMLTNRGPTPLPIGTADAGGVEGLLPPGLEIAIANDQVGTFVVGEQPEPAGRSKLAALAVDPDSPLAVEYGTDIDQWKGRSDPGAEQAVMDVWLFVKNVGPDDVVVTTTEGATTLKTSEGVLVETIAGLKVEGAVVESPTPPMGDLQITSFTATLDTTATAMDTAMLDAGDTITLTAVAGAPESMALIDGFTGGVYNLAGNTFQIAGLDLSAADVTDLAATATVAPVVDTTGTITAFSQADPTQVAMDTEDEAMLVVGQSITLEALTGDPDAMVFIDGAIVEVLSKAPVTLALDLSGVDVAALTADFTLHAGSGQQTTVPPWTFRHFTSVNPVVAHVDDTTGLAQGDYMVFTGIEGTQGQRDFITGKSGQIQSINGNTVQVGYSGQAPGDNITGLVAVAMKQ